MCDQNKCYDYYADNKNIEKRASTKLNKQLLNPKLLKLPIFEKRNYS